jgi:hypothetical protein
MAAKHAFGVDVGIRLPADSRCSGLGCVYPAPFTPTLLTSPFLMVPVKFTATKIFEGRTRIWILQRCTLSPFALTGLLLANSAHMKNIKKEEKRFMTQTMFSLVQYCARIVPVGPSAPWMKSELTRTYLPQFSIFFVLRYLA